MKKKKKKRERLFEARTNNRIHQVVTEFVSTSGILWNKNRFGRVSPAYSLQDIVALCFFFPPREIICSLRMEKKKREDILFSYLRLHQQKQFCEKNNNRNIIFIPIVGSYILVDSGN